MGRVTDRGRGVRGVAAVLAAGLLAAGCDGGGGRRPAGEWSADICSSLGSWQEEIQQRAAEVQAEFERTERGDLPRIQELTVGFLNQATDSTDRLVRELEEAGVPDVEGGERVREVFVTNLQEVRRTFDEASRDVEQLPTDDLEVFEEGLRSFQSAMEQFAIQVNEAFQEVGTEGVGGDELNQAFAEQEECRALSPAA